MLAQLSFTPRTIRERGSRFEDSPRPGSVVAVLIDVNPVSLSTNVDRVDDTTIKVTVPGAISPVPTRSRREFYFYRETDTGFRKAVEVALSTFEKYTFQRRNE